MRDCSGMWNVSRGPGVIWDHGRVTVRSHHQVLIVGATDLSIALARRLQARRIQLTIVERRCRSHRSDTEPDVFGDIEFDTELVDARWKPRMERWQSRLGTSNGIQLRHHRLLVLATDAELDITGRHGVTLRAARADGLRRAAGESGCDPRLPNLFLPRRGPVSEADYIDALIAAVAGLGFSPSSPRADH